MVLQLGRCRTLLILPDGIGWLSEEVWRCKMPLVTAAYGRISDASCRGIAGCVAFLAGVSSVSGEVHPTIAKVYRLKLMSLNWI